MGQIEIEIVREFDAHDADATRHTLREYREYRTGAPPLALISGCEVALISRRMMIAMCSRSARGSIESYAPRRSRLLPTSSRAFAGPHLWSSGGCGLNGDLPPDILTGRQASRPRRCGGGEWQLKMGALGARKRPRGCYCLRGLDDGINVLGSRPFRVSDVEPVLAGMNPA